MTEHQIKSMNADQYDQMKADKKGLDPIRQVADPKNPTISFELINF